MCNPIQAVSRAIDFTVWAGQKTTQGVVNITADITKDVGGVRALAAGVTTAVEALELWGVPVSSLASLVQTCKSFNKGMAGINILSRAGEFADGRAFSNILRMASRIAFICYDFLTSLEWLENMSLISAGTANAIAMPIFGTTAGKILPTVSFVAFATDLAEQVHNLVYEGPKWDTGFSIGSDVARLTMISLSVIPGRIPQMARIAAGLTGTAIVFSRAIVKRYA